jgi:hypothetical protein
VLKYGQFNDTCSQQDCHVHFKPETEVNTSNSVFSKWIYIL